MWLVPDVCNNVLQSCICVIYIKKFIICLFVDQLNAKLHIEGFYIFVVSAVSFLRWKMWCWVVSVNFLCIQAHILKFECFSGTQWLRLASLRGSLGNVPLWFRQKQSQLLKRLCLIWMMVKVQRKDVMLVSHKPLS